MPKLVAAITPDSISVKEVGSHREINCTLEDIPKFILMGISDELFLVSSWTKNNEKKILSKSGVIDVSPISSIYDWFTNNCSITLT